MGTILILVVYFLANLALPFYYRKYRPDEFNVSSTSCCRSSAWSRSPSRSTTCSSRGSPQPYDWFPYAALGIVMVSILYAIWLVRRDPGLGDRVGSIVADE